MDSIVPFVAAYALAAALGVGVYATCRRAERRVRVVAPALGALTLMAVLGWWASVGFRISPVTPRPVFVLALAILAMLLAAGAWAHRASGGASPTRGHAFLCLFLSTALSLAIGMALSRSVAPLAAFLAAPRFSVPFDRGFLSLSPGALLDLSVLLWPSMAPLLWLTRRLRPEPGVTGTSPRPRA